VVNDVSGRGGCAATDYGTPPDDAWVAVAMDDMANCNVYQKALAAQEAGASAFVSVDHEHSEAFECSRQPSRPLFLLRPLPDDCSPLARFVRTHVGLGFK
jgi:hypothetical protein